MPKKILPILLFLIAVFLAPKAADAATATGTIESEIFDAGVGVNWKEMSWTASTSASSTITMKVRTGTTSNLAWAADWDSCSAVSSGADISGNACVTDGERYAQYYALLSNEYSGTSTFASPELYGVEIAYEAAGILVSSPYDTLADDTELSEVRWGETLPASTDILIQLRTSADASAWTAWLGPDGTADDYFTDASGGESLPAVFSDASGERYFQYRVVLDSGGADLPVLSDITIDYSAAVPVVNSADPAYAWSNASGTISVALSGANFASGWTVSVESGGSTFTPDDRNGSGDSISFSLDTGQLFGGPAAITITNPNGASVTYNDFYINQYRGTYVSEAKELPNLYFNAISWNAVETATSSVTLKVRTDSASDMSGATAWSACADAASGTDISANACVADGERYVQYRADLRATYGTSTDYYTPELLDVTLGYARYAASGTLSSSYYDTGSAVNAWRLLSWTETLPAGTDILLQLRTAPDSAGSPGTWSAWYGAYEAGGYYRDSTGASGVYLDYTDGANDQWLQYRAILESDGAAAPILSDISLDYGDKTYSDVIIKDGTIINDEVILR